MMTGIAAARSEAAYHRIRKIDEQGGSQHNQERRESDICSLTGARSFVRGIDVRRGLAKTDDCQDHRRAAKRNEKQPGNVANELSAHR
jgi:hypothetical protein